MVDSNELIPILRSVLVFRLTRKLSIQTDITIGPRETLLADMREHLAVHFNFVKGAVAINVGRADLVYLFLAHVLVLGKFTNNYC